MAFSRIAEAGASQRDFALKWLFGGVRGAVQRAGWDASADLEAPITRFGGDGISPHRDNALFDENDLPLAETVALIAAAGIERAKLLGSITNGRVRSKTF